MRTKEITPPPKNAALGNATVFKTLQRIAALEPFTVE